jgi:hypothetical protein
MEKLGPRGKVRAASHAEKNLESAASSAAESAA